MLGGGWGRAGGGHRAQALAETGLGKIANGYMSNGEMLPSDVVLPLVTKRLGQRDCLQNGWIMDGEGLMSLDGREERWVRRGPVSVYCRRQ